MCNLADGIYEYGLAQGEARGIAIAEARAEARGEIKGAIKLYRDEFNLAPTEIIRKIMARFDLDEQAAEKYIEETLGLQLA